MSLIPNAAELFLKLWSIRVAGFNTLLAVAYAMMQQLQAVIAPETFALIMAGLNLLNMVARMTKQSGLPGESDAGSPGSGFY